MEILLALVAAPIMNFVIERAKTKWSLKWEVVLVAVALLIWVVYVSFQTIVPDVLEAKVNEFVWQAGLFSVIIYEFLIKTYLAKEE